MAVVMRRRENEAGSAEVSVSWGDACGTEAEIRHARRVIPIKAGEDSAACTASEVRSSATPIRLVLTLEEHRAVWSR